ncbi:MAG: hypothetical protein OEZ05_12935 [Nitrospirota bacterium]|nr:hypothetical protein [Nitrospirota bacterium]
MKSVTLIGLFSSPMLCVASVGFAKDFEDHAQKANQVAPLTVDEVIKIAMLHFPRKVTKSELEDERGQSLHEMSFVNEAESYRRSKWMRIQEAL